jgi:hypothetical protein
LGTGSKIAVGAGKVGGRFFGGVGSVNIPWNAIWSKTIVEESQRYGYDITGGKTDALFDPNKVY